MKNRALFPRVFPWVLASAVAVSASDRPGLIEAEGADDFWKFYEKYPRLQDFYPFGVYGDPGRWSPFGHSPETYNQILLDLLAENYVNVIWSTSTHRLVVDPEDMKSPKLSSFGRWYYGEELKLHEMKAIPSLINWMRFDKPVFSKYQRAEPFLNEKEIAEVEKELRGVLDFAKQIGQSYPDSIVGFVSDDEPSHLAPAIAALRLLEKNTMLPATTCIPSWGGFQVFAAHMQPATGDWYPTGDATRNSWSVASNLRWLQENHPDRVFWFLPLASAYHGGHEPTLPGLRDSRPSRAELRLQFWQAVALGCKGFFYYNTGGWIDWAGGEDNLLNPVLKPNVPDNLMEEIRELGRDITAIGPLLLSCRPDTSISLKSHSGVVRYPEFEGPALDCGLLKDVRNDRYFVVVWNNDVDQMRPGGVFFPPEVLANRKVYDLSTLEETEYFEEGRFLKLPLPPGGGRIFLIANEKEFAACRDTILRHRVTPERVRARMRLRLATAQRVESKEANELVAQAQAAERERNWEKAAWLYRGVVASIDKAEAKVADLKPTRDALDRVAEVLSVSDDLLRTSGYRLFDLPRDNQHFHWNHFLNKDIGKELRDWVSLCQGYFDALGRFRAGQFWSFTLHDQLLSLEEWAKQNQQAIQTAIDKRLAEVRKPFRVAFVTPDRNEVESTILYAWGWEHCQVTWITPNRKGQLTDAAGKAFNPADYEVVWIHQLRFQQPVPKDQKVESADVLMPELVDKPMLQTLRNFVENGGGLLLSGIAGLYTLVLEVEKTPPDRLRENSFFQRAFGVGLAPAADCAKHPVFAGLPTDGFYTNANFPENNLVPECAYEMKNPSGILVANELDDVYGPIENYASIIEYRLGKGKVMVFGGRSCDFSPGEAFSLPKGNDRFALRDRMRTVTLNALGYLASKETFQPEKAATAVREREKPQFLPVEGWLFRTDPKNVGMRDGWFRPGLDTRDWKPLRVDSNWESQGFANYDGYAWYRFAFTAANRPGKKAMLRFGAVDEEAVVYIDGKLAGKHQEGPNGWDKPFALDITNLLTDSPKEHLLAVQVFDSMAAGGIWKPVALGYE